MDLQSELTSCKTGQHTCKLQNTTGICTFWACFWDLSWAVLGLSWAVLGLSSAVLGLSWAVLGLPWAALGLYCKTPLDSGCCGTVFGTCLGLFWTCLGLPWACHGLSWAVLALSWAVLALSWAVWGLSWACHGLSWACLGLSWAVWGLSWAVLGLSWAALGLSWAALGLSWPACLPGLPVSICLPGPGCLGWLALAWVGMGGRGEVGGSRRACVELTLNSAQVLYRPRRACEALTITLN